VEMDIGAGEAREAPYIPPAPQLDETQPNVGQCHAISAPSLSQEAGR